MRSFAPSLPHPARWYSRALPAHCVTSLRLPPSRSTPRGHSSRKARTSVALFAEKNAGSAELRRFVTQPKEISAAW